MRSTARLRGTDRCAAAAQDPTQPMDVVSEVRVEDWLFSFPRLSGGEGS